jgi:type I restriction enzyme, R subunit
MSRNAIDDAALEAEIGRLPDLSLLELRHRWKTLFGHPAPKSLRRNFLARAVAYQMLVEAYKVFNLVRGLQKEIDDNADAAPALQPLKDRAERILKDLENRNTTGLAAMDLLAALAADKDAAAKAAKESGLTPKAFAAFWSLRDSAVLKSGGIDPLELAREIEKLLARFPNAKVNPDEQRQLRAALYRPLLALGRDERTKIVELIVEIVTQ